MNYKILENEPMSGHTTFRVGGPADIYIIPQSIEGLKEAIKDYTFGESKPLIIGNGSNLLVSDKGIRGVVIEIGSQLSQITLIDNDDGSGLECKKIYAEAGAKLSKLAREAYENGLSGAEFASGIPGTVGGAVFMNAGAYGGEIKDIVDYVDVICDGELKSIKGSDMGFAYRYSKAMDQDMVVVGAMFTFKKDNPEDILARMNDFNQRRRDKQPLEYPSAGSTFKRPENHFAGKLIMDSGLAGQCFGGAMVSDKHCGFIINYDNATACDIYNLIKLVQSKVKDRFGVELETEVRLIGEF